MRIGLIFFICIFSVFALAINVGNVIYENYHSNETVNMYMYKMHTINGTFNIYDYTDATFNHSEYDFNTTTNYNKTNGTEVASVRINNIVNKITDATTYILFEATKIGVEYGYNHKAEYDVVWLLNVIKWVAIIMIIYFSIFPIAIIYVLGNNIYKWIKNKR